MENNQQRKSKWPLLRNVIRAVTLFKTHDATQAEDLNTLIKEIKAIPTDQVYRINTIRTKEKSAYSVAIKDLRREQRFSLCVERGSPEDLENIRLLIEQDPYRMLRDSSHPNSLINKRNKEGQTPLYIACKHGNLDIVQFLLEQNADHLILSSVEEESETCLEVAVRWRHVNIIQELLKKKWPPGVIKTCLKLSTSKEIKALFKGQSKKKCFFCCFKGD